MGWSGGSFTRTDGTRTGSTVWAQAEAAAVKIISADHDTHDQDLAAGVNQALNKDGSNAATANLDMGNFIHTNVGDATARTHYASAADIQDNQLAHKTTTGSGGAYVLTPVPAITALATGQQFTFKASFTSTGAATLAVSGLTAKSLTNVQGVQLGAYELIIGGIYIAVYDSALDAFVVIGKDPGTEGWITFHTWTVTTATTEQLDNANVTIVSDPSTLWDTTNDYFTVPTAGARIEITASLGSTSISGGLRLECRKNATAAGGTGAPPDLWTSEDSNVAVAGGNQMVNLHFMDVCVAGDDYNFTARHDKGTDLVVFGEIRARIY